jgi:hypothetical protein
VVCDIISYFLHAERQRIMKTKLRLLQFWAFIFEIILSDLTHSQFIFLDVESEVPTEMVMKSSMYCRVGGN